MLSARLWTCCAPGGVRRGRKAGLHGYGDVRCIKPALPLKFVLDVLFDIIVGSHRRSPGKAGRRSKMESQAMADRMLIDSRRRARRGHDIDQFSAAGIDFAVLA